MVYFKMFYLRDKRFNCNRRLTVTTIHQKALENMPYSKYLASKFREI